jgi:hypothetical protein
MERREIRTVGGGMCPPDGKRPLCRPRRRWEDNIRMNLVDRI